MCVYTRQTNYFFCNRSLFRRVCPSNSTIHWLCFFTVRALWFQLVLFTQLQPSNVPTQTNVSGFFYTKISLPSNFAVHMPFQEHISFWLDGVQLYNFHFSYCSRLVAVPSCVGKGLSEGWRWRIQFCTKWWWIYGNWMPWWQHLTCWFVDWRRYFSLMKMPLSPKRPVAIPIRQLRESTLFSCRPSTSRLMEMLLLKGTLIASRLVVHERRWGDQQNASPNRFNPANKFLIFSISKKKSRNERPNY